MYDVSTEYGRAIFELALEENKDRLYLEQLREINKLLEENPEFIHLLYSLNIPLSERLQVIDEVFENRAEEYICSFMKLITERGYAAQIPECIKAFEKLYYKEHKITIAYVKSAVALTDGQKSALIKKLQIYSGKTIELDCTVEPKLIGGISVRIDGKLLDGSIKHKIDTIRSNLQKATL